MRTHEKNKAHKWNRVKAWKAVRSWTLLNFYVYSYSVFWKRLSEEMGYDQYTVPDPVAVKTIFYCFPLVLANICPWPLGNSFKFLWRTVNSNPPTIPFRIVTSTFSDNLSRNSCIHKCYVYTQGCAQRKNWRMPSALKLWNPGCSAWDFY